MKRIIFFLILISGITTAQPVKPPVPGGGETGTVTNVSSANTNISVANPTTTPVLSTNSWVTFNRQSLAWDTFDPAFYFRNISIGTKTLQMIYAGNKLYFRDSAAALNTLLTLDDSLNTVSLGTSVSNTSRLRVDRTGLPNSVAGSEAIWGQGTLQGADTTRDVIIYADAILRNTNAGTEVAGLGTVVSIDTAGITGKIHGVDAHVGNTTTNDAPMNGLAVGIHSNVPSPANTNGLLIANYPFSSSNLTVASPKSATNAIAIYSGLSGLGGFKYPLTYRLPDGGALETGTIKLQADSLGGLSIAGSRSSTDSTLEVNGSANITSNFALGGKFRITSSNLNTSLDVDDYGRLTLGTSIWPVITASIDTNFLLRISKPYGAASTISMLSGTGNASVMRIYGYGGSDIASPTAKAGTIFNIVGGGYDGSAWVNSKITLGFSAAGTWSTTSTPTYFTFSTTPTGSTTQAERMRIDSSGYIGIGDATPAYLLTVGSGDLFGVNSSGEIIGNSVTRGSNSFTTTATEDTVTITGTSVNDYYQITLTGTAAPAATDAIRLEKISTGFILHRGVAGTSGLTYDWWRVK